MKVKVIMDLHIALSTDSAPSTGHNNSLDIFAYLQPEHVFFLTTKQALDYKTMKIRSFRFIFALPVLLCRSVGKHIPTNIDPLIILQKRAVQIAHTGTHQ